MDEDLFQLSVAEMFTIVYASDDSLRSEASLLKTRVFTFKAAQDKNIKVEPESFNAFEDIGPSLNHDAVTSAKLISLDLRDDVSLFKMNYHFSPTQIEQIGESLVASAIPSLITSCRCTKRRICSVVNESEEPVKGLGDCSCQSNEARQASCDSEESGNRESVSS